MKNYRPWTPTQSELLPVSPLEWLPEGHLAYFVLEVVAALDLSAIEAAIQEKDGRGERPYDPRMMAALLLYGYSVGVFSSRRIGRATYEDVAFRVIAGGARPHFTTLNQYRLDHLTALQGLFVQMLKLCRRAGLVTLGHVSLDGTKVQANASKHKAMSYQRMLEEEKELAAEVAALLERARRTDEEEDDRYGKACEPMDLPEELARRERRMSRIQEAKQALEREAIEVRAGILRERAKQQREKAANETVDFVERKRARARADKTEQQAKALVDKGDDDRPPPSPTSDEALPHHRVATTKRARPTNAAQRNFTDPESCIMVRDGAFVQAYNAQIAADAASQIIVSEAVTNQPPDQQHLTPVIDRAIANCGKTPTVATADAGYFSASNAAYCDSKGIKAFIAVGRDRKRNAGATGGMAANPAATIMRARLSTPEGKATYALRKTVPEPIFGQIKEARGFRRFHLRGLSKVRAEWSLVCSTHNLLKLFRAVGSISAIPA